MKAHIITFAIAALAVLSGVALAQSIAAGFADLPVRHPNGSAAASP